MSLSPDNGYQHEKAAIMAMISKYQVDPSLYLGGKDPDKEYLRRMIFAPLDFSSQKNPRNELSDKLFDGTYRPMKSPLNDFYSIAGKELGKYN